MNRKLYTYEVFASRGHVKMGKDRLIGWRKTINQALHFVKQLNTQFGYKITMIVERDRRQDDFSY